AVALGQLGEQALGVGEHARRTRAVAAGHEVAGPLGEVAHHRPWEGGTTGPGAAAGAEPGPLEGQGGVGDRPALVDAADAGVVRDAPVGDEYLVEQSPARHLPQGSDLDGAALVHLEGEV